MIQNSNQQQSGVYDFESFLQSLEIPASCKLGKPIFKKMFHDNGALDATEKRILKDDIEKIRWLYTLKPSTINIAPYQDEFQEYTEIAVLHIEVSSSARLNRIAHFVNRSIPYPLVILSTYQSGGEDCLSICLCEKRINQADKEKWVIVDILETGPMYLDNVSQPQGQPVGEFLASLKITNLPFTNLWQFYMGLMDRVIAYKCAEHSHTFELKAKNSSDGLSRLERLKSIHKLEAERAELSNKLKKEKQLGRQVQLNTKVKNIRDEIAIIKSRL